jgi:electron transport complex protein RnfG
MKNDIIRYMATLGAITVVSTLIMAFVFILTKPAIEEANRQDFLAGLSAVLPEYDNFPDQEIIVIDNQTLYIAKKADQIVGYAAQGSSFKGYGGEISVIVGVLPDLSIYGVNVVKHTETPGLGDKITAPEFLKMFVRKKISERYAVRADGGDIDQFSGATISPRAVCDAVNAANAILAKGMAQ